MDYSTPDFPVFHHLLKFVQTHIHWVNDAIQPSRPLSSPSTLAFDLPQNQGLCEWLSSSNHVAKVLKLQQQTFQWIFGLISFRMDWLDLQRTLKSLLQHHSLKASILQLLHTYMTTGKTIALTIQTFVGKIMSLLFNMLSRLVIAFLSRSKHILILCLQSPVTVILEPKK